MADSESPAARVWKSATRTSREKLASADRCERRAGNLQQIVERIKTEAIVPADPLPPQKEEPRIYRVCWQHRRTKKISCSPWMGHGEATARIERVICSTQHTYWLERKPDDHSAIVGVLREFTDLIIRARNLLAEHGYGLEKGEQT